MASPEPKTPPTTACVPEIGIDETDDDIMKRNEAKQTENIQIY